jgi:ATP-dependent exoDNAse (exonuclease V) beta subunit
MTMIINCLDKLKTYDSDPDFKFDPKYHRYTYKGNKLTSVTNFIQRFHRPFDSNYWSKIKAEESGETQEEILLQWKIINDRSNEIGTATHNWIENYYNRKYQEIPDDIDVINRVNKFNIIYATHLSKLTPVKFEQRIFSKRWNLAGTFDSLFLYKGNLIVIDFKTNKDFTTDDSKFGMGERLLAPFDKFFKNHQTEYSIQVSLYSLILKEVEINIKKGYLLHIGPESDAKIYGCIDFTKELEEYLSNNSI